MWLNWAALKAKEEEGRSENIYYVFRECGVVFSGTLKHIHVTLILGMTAMDGGNACERQDAGVAHASKSPAKTTPHSLNTLMSFSSMVVKSEEQNQERIGEHYSPKRLIELFSFALYFPLFLLRAKGD